MPPFKANRPFKATQRFRVIINGISFYTTAGAIRDGVGDFTKVNEAVNEAMKALERTRVNDPAVGLTGAWFGYAVQLSMV